MICKPCLGDRITLSFMLHCGSEQEGLNAFYKLLDEFKNRDKSLDIKDEFVTNCEEIVEESRKK